MKMVNKIENQREIWYKIIENCQMTDFCEKIDQLYVQLFLELNGIWDEALLLWGSTWAILKKKNKNGFAQKKKNLILKKKK